MTGMVSLVDMQQSHIDQTTEPARKGCVVKRKENDDKYKQLLTLSNPFYLFHPTCMY